MPADDGLHGMSTEDLATFLHGLRALREREGLGLDGTGLPLGRGPQRRRWRPGAGLVGVTASGDSPGWAGRRGRRADRFGRAQREQRSPGPLPGSGRSMTSHRGRMHMHIRPARGAVPG